MWYWVILALFLIGILWWSPFGAPIFSGSLWTQYHQDFPAPYAAAHLIASGSGHQLYDVPTIAQEEARFVGHPVGDSGVLAYFNPPFFALLLAPLSTLSIDRAFQVWTGINLALVVVDLWMLWRVTAPLSRPARIALTLAFVTLYPVIYGLLIGQFSMILATSWMGAFLLLRSGHERWAGVALAPLLIKPELLVPVTLFLVLKRRRRVFVTLAPITLAAIGLSVAVVGRASALAYPGYLLSSTRWSTNGIAPNVMFSWNGIVAMFWDQPSTVPVATAGVAVMSVVTLVAVAHTWRGEIEPRSDRFALQWCVLTVGTVLVDPHLYLQDTALLALPAMALLAATPVRHRGIVAIALLGGWALLGLGIYPNERLDVNLFGVYMTAACLLLMIYASRWSPHRNAAAVAVEAGLRRSKATWRTRLARGRDQHTRVDAERKDEDPEREPPDDVRRPVGSVIHPLEAD